MLVWTDDMLKAFNGAKVALVEAAILTHPHKGAPTVLTMDISDEAVGEVQQQQQIHVHGVWLSLAFFSKQLHPEKKNYSAFRSFGPSN